jgi:hypothetical protein
MFVRRRVRVSHAAEVFRALTFVPYNGPRVAHILLVFREMWATTILMSRVYGVFGA